MGLAGGVHRLLQLGRVHLDVLAGGAAGLGQVGAGVGRPVDDHQLPGLHLVDDLLDGVAVRAPLVVDVRHPGPDGGGRGGGGGGERGGGGGGLG